MWERYRTSIPLPTYWWPRRDMNTQPSDQCWGIAHRYLSPHIGNKPLHSNGHVLIDAHVGGSPQLPCNVLSFNMRFYQPRMAKLRNKTRVGIFFRGFTNVVSLIIDSAVNPRVYQN
jgi:hypothetical protein